jgi:hypothetical protein
MLSHFFSVNLPEIKTNYMRLPFFVLIIILFSSSCASRRYIYSSSPANDPYFSGKGQSQLSALYSFSGANDDASTTGYAHGYDMQGAYSIADHWALTAGYFNRKEKNIYSYYSFNSPFDSSIVKYKRNLVELGAGYFLPLDREKDIFFNLYGGIGFGKFSFDDNGINNGTAYNRYHTSNITKWFFRPAINVTTGRYFRAALLLGSSLVHYGNIHTSYTATELQSFSLDRIANRTLYFFEPGINFQFGVPEFPWIKLDMSISGVSHSSVDDILGVRGANTSIGLTFDPSARKRK